MAHITRISAGKSKRPANDDDDTVAKTKIKASSSSKKTEDAPKTHKTVVKAEKSAKIEKVSKTEKAEKSVKESKKAPKEVKKSEKKHGVFYAITSPFRALGRYFKDSWRELRQVRWPNRKATWKMVFAVFVYTAIFMVMIMLLDALFTLVFNNILG